MAQFNILITGNVWTFNNIKITCRNGTVFYLPYYPYNFGRSVENGDVIYLKPEQTDVGTICNLTFNNVASSYNPKTGFDNLVDYFGSGNANIQLEIWQDNVILRLRDGSNNTFQSSINSTANAANPLVAVLNTYDNKIVALSPMGYIFTNAILQSTPTIPHISVVTNQRITSVVYYTYNSSSHNAVVCNALTEAGEIVVPPTDPYSGVGDSTTGGGDGTFDGSSDPVPVPSLPSVGAQDSGFITLFAPTAQQMKDLAHFMWVNPLFDLSAFKKIFADPMDCILGLSVVPVSVPTGGAQNVNIGNIVTSVTMNVASQQYIEVDCGTVTMQRFFGSYLDFEPYTKISIFLPYCGTHQLNADDISGKTIGVVYHIDILTGSCIAFVKCGDSVLYEFNGACGSNIPVNSLNFASTIENAIRIAVNIGTTVATAGASAPVTAATEGAQAIGKAANVGRAISLAGSTAEGALSMKPNVSRSGALGGGVGLLGHQIPYMIISRPRLCKPAKQDFFQGYPSFIQTTIGDLIGKGFTSFTNVIIAGQYLTDEEETELESILESGVYL
ncbi:MAG: hypothetical protein J6S67_24485 [Methanobrevibacter sp.]|nr:hypothetical protein [Methanobrevibacter sp.]